MKSFLEKQFAIKSVGVKSKRWPRCYNSQNPHSKESEKALTNNNIENLALFNFLNLSATNIRKRRLLT